MTKSEVFAVLWMTSLLGLIVIGAAFSSCEDSPWDGKQSATQPFYCPWIMVPR